MKIYSGRKDNDDDDVDEVDDVFNYFLNKFVQKLTDTGGPRRRQ